MNKLSLVEKIFEFSPDDGGSITIEFNTPTAAHLVLARGEWGAAKWEQRGVGPISDWQTQGTNYIEVISGNYKFFKQANYQGESLVVQQGGTLPWPSEMRSLQPV